jgi:hypothetical protein
MGFAEQGQSAPVPEILAHCERAYAVEKIWNGRCRAIGMAMQTPLAPGSFIASASALSHAAIES